MQKNETDPTLHTGKLRHYLVTALYELTVYTVLLQSALPGPYAWLMQHVQHINL